jgi:hypothetical protein
MESERHGSSRSPGILEARSAFRRAVLVLEDRYGLSPRKARERIYQEARIKRASLEEVARAVIADRFVSYHYVLPTRVGRSKR